MISMDTNKGLDIAKEIGLALSAGVIPEGESDDFFSKLGASTLQGVLGGLSSQEGGVLKAGIVGGGLGILDSAVAYGVDKIPGPAGEIFKGVTDSIDFSKAPALISNLFDTANNGGLNDFVNNTLSNIDFNNLNVNELTDLINGGSLGDVAQAFQSFNNIEGLKTLVPGISLTASSLMGGIGLGGPLALALPGGIGFEAATALLNGENPLAAIIGGGGVFGGLFGGVGGLGCPCDPKCRKTKHGVDSDGNRLLDPCKALTIGNSNVYKGAGDILNNNSGAIASALGFVSTGIGSELIPKNLLDFTGAIKSIPRVNELSKKFEDAFKGGAEGTDMMLETIYSLEAIEKTFKIADNNISIMELIERLGLLGSQSFMNNIITGNKGGLLGNMTTDMATQAQAIDDLHRMVRELNAVKDGSRAEVTATPAIVATKKSKVKIPKYFNKSRIAAIINLVKTILEALSTLASLDPQLGTPFKNLKTRNNKSKVLNDSLAAQFNTNQPSEDTLNSDFVEYTPSSIKSLSKNQLDSGEFDVLLNQINNEQERARRGEGSCS